MPTPLWQVVDVYDLAVNIRRVLNVVVVRDSHVRLVHQEVLKSQRDRQRQFDLLLFRCVELELIRPLQVYPARHRARGGHGWWRGRCRRWRMWSGRRGGRGRGLISFDREADHYRYAESTYRQHYQPGHQPPHLRPEPTTLRARAAAPFVETVAALTT